MKLSTLVYIMLITACMTGCNTSQVVDQQIEKKTTENVQSENKKYTVEETETEVVYYNAEGDIIKVVKKKQKKSIDEKNNTNIEIVTDVSSDTTVVETHWYDKILQGIVQFGLWIATIVLCIAAIFVVVRFRLWKIVLKLFKK